MEALALAGKYRQGRRRSGVGPGRKRSRKRYFADKTANISLRDLYGHLVSTSLAVRRDRFSAHVKRVTAHVKQHKKWTLKKLLEEADVAKPVYYRWVNGEWTGDLEPSPIERFHDAADWPVSDAWDILWPGKYGRRAPTQPAPTNPEFDAIMRILNDPKTSKEDAIVIQATMDMLLARIAPADRKLRNR
jgi:hypothetical protein